MKRLLEAVLPQPLLRSAYRVVSPTFRKAEGPRARAFAANRKVMKRFGPAFLNDGGRRALVVAIGGEGVAAETALCYVFRAAGFNPIAAATGDFWGRRYLTAAGVPVIEFGQLEPDLDEAARQMPRVQTFDDLVALEYQGVRVGRFAASTAMRGLRSGTLDVAGGDRDVVLRRLARSIAAVDAGQRLLREARCHLILMVDRGYTPSGELFDLALAQGIDAITWNAAHKSGALVFKRYHAGNRDDHFSSLSAASWARMREMRWTSAHSDAILNELRSCYESGDWYSEVGTQFGRKTQAAEDLRRRLGLRPGKPVALVLPHILWDGTFFWGEDLFANYEDWFSQTMRAAAENPNVEWLVKIHPANLTKDAREKVSREPAEVQVIRRDLGTLPPHIHLIPPEFDVTTFSFFHLADYCVTVRGTVGLEASPLGVPVLTAGTGRYDRRGFTIDSDTPREYLDRLKAIETIPRLTPHEQELAQRFAYGVFLLRPVRLRSFTFEFRQDAQASLETRLVARTWHDWQAAEDVRQLASWLQSRDEDFLHTDDAPEPRLPQRLESSTKVRS